MVEEEKNNKDDGKPYTHDYKGKRIKIKQIAITNNLLDSSTNFKILPGVKYEPTESSQN